MSRDSVLRPLAAADAFVHSAPNPKQRSRSEVIVLDLAQQRRDFGFRFPAVSCLWSWRRPWLLRTGKRGGCWVGNHGPIRDSWPI